MKVRNINAQLGDAVVKVIYQVLGGSERATVTCPASDPSVELLSVLIGPTEEEAPIECFSPDTVRAWERECVEAVRSWEDDEADELADALCDRELETA